MDPRRPGPLLGWVFSAEAGGEDWSKSDVSWRGAFFEVADWVVETWVAAGFDSGGDQAGADKANVVGLVLEPLRRELDAGLACGVGLNMVFEALSGGPFMMWFRRSGKGMVDKGIGRRRASGTKRQRQRPSVVHRVMRSLPLDAWASEAVSGFCLSAGCDAPMRVPKSRCALGAPLCRKGRIFSAAMQVHAYNNTNGSRVHYTDYWRGPSGRGHGGRTIPERDQDLGGAEPGEDDGPHGERRR